jgi:crotonobetainyl-CoA hydratase
MMHPPEPRTGAPPAALVERHGYTMVITLNRPEARNAVNLDLGVIVGEAVDEADQDPGVRVVVITGAGDRSFCAGADLKAIARGERFYAPGREHWGFAGYVRHFISKPTIAAVNGTALGGGTELVLASDLAVAVETATFGLPEVQRGLVAGAGGAFRIANQLPRKLANHILLTGQAIDARTALAWGLVNEVVPPADLLPRTLELADRLARNAPLAVAASKRISYAVSDRSEPAGEAPLWDLTSAEAARLMRSEDAAEGPRAFAEKRPPVWLGR